MEVQVAFWKAQGASLFVTDRDVLLLADSARRAATALRGYSGSTTYSAEP